MPYKSKRPCPYPGCPNLVESGYCDRHRKQEQRRQDERRGTAAERGYSYRWSQYSKWFLRQPENQFCKLQLPGCSNIAECVDHIDPPDGPDDPKFWDPNNHQGACIHCNSMKGRKVMIGTGKPFEVDLQG